MNQYEAAYQDTKPSIQKERVAAMEQLKTNMEGHKPTEAELADLFGQESALDQRDINQSRAEHDLAPIGDRHFHPVITRIKTVFEVIYGPGDKDSFTTTDWNLAYANAKAQAKMFGEAVTIQVTEDKEYTIG